MYTTINSVHPIICLKTLYIQLSDIEGISRLKQGANPETGSEKTQIEPKPSITCVIFIYYYKSSCFGSKSKSCDDHTDQHLL